MSATPAAIAAPPASATSALAGPALAAVALATVAAGGYAVVAPSYAQRWWAFGVLFGIAAALHGVLAIAIALRPPTPVVWSAFVTATTLIALFVVSRTAGMPFGPEPLPAVDPRGGLHAAGRPDISLQLTDRPDPVGPIDAVTILAEVGLVVALLALLGSAQRRVAVNVLLVMGATLWALRWAGVLA